MMMRRFGEKRPRHAHPLKNDNPPSLPPSLVHLAHHAAVHGVAHRPLQLDEPVEGVEELAQVAADGVGLASVLQLEQGHAGGEEAARVAGWVGGGRDWGGKG